MLVNSQQSAAIKMDISQISETIVKELTLSKSDKIDAFKLLSWASLCSIFLAFWQIVIPLKLFKLNFSQLCLGYTSIFFLIISIFMLYWSSNNYKYLRDTKEENPILHSLHVEGTIYIISFILISCYITFMIGIIVERGYSEALLIASGTPINQAPKHSIVLMIAQCVLILGDIAVLIIYIRYNYHLELLSVHLPSVLGFFYSLVVIVICLILGDQDYLRSYIGTELFKDYKIASKIHQQIFISSIGVVVAVFYLLFEGRTRQLQQYPKIRFFLAPFLIFLVYGFYILFQGIQFYYTARKMDLSMNMSCKQLLQTYDQTFIEQIGCVSKYKTYTDGNKILYDQNCQTKSTGIVWEQDYGKNINQHNNQLACLNVNCCYLIREQRSLKFTGFTLLCILAANISFVIAGHALDIAIQKPSKIKGNPNNYPVLKLIGQYAIIVLGILAAGFWALQYSVIIPRRFPDIVNDPKIFNKQFKKYDYDVSISSIPQCQKVQSLSKLNLAVKFNKEDCPKDIKNDPNKCNQEQQGFLFCLNGQFGVFQLTTIWNSQQIRIKSNTALEISTLQKGLNGEQQTDQFCAAGSQIYVNQLISENLYFCANPNKTPQITWQYKQEPLDFIKYPVKQKNNKVVKQPEKKFKPKSKKHLQLGDFLKQNKYFNLKISIYAVEKEGMIEGAVIKLYKNQDKCELLNDLISYPYYEFRSNQQGIAIADNIQFQDKDSFLIQIRADGYYYNCYTFTNIQAESTIEKYIPLVQIMKKMQNLKVLLFYQNSALNFELGATFNINSTAQCYTGYQMENCGGITYSVSYLNKQKTHQNPSQVITIDQFVKKEYMFYVQMIPTSLQLRNKVFNNQQLNQEEKQAVQALNEAFVKEEVFLNVYIRDRIFPVRVLATPTSLPPDAIKDQNQFWLALCMNGEVGPTSNVQISSFWSKKESISNLPNAEICKPLIRKQQEDL